MHIGAHDASAGERARVILVDADDRELGSEDKLAAHQDGALHRAFSVFLFDDAGRLLLQRRAAGKYHSPGLWSNTCCSHPAPGESTPEAARDRLMHEMGIACPVDGAFRFLYRASVGGGLIEHELDHVFVGRFEGEPRPNPGEVDAWRWVAPAALAADLRDNPAEYAVWLRIALDEFAARGMLDGLDRSGGASAAG